MCDADAYATGLLLTQIGVGLLASTLLNTVTNNIHRALPTAQAVPVFDSPEEDDEEAEAAEPVVPPVERVGQVLRRRNLKQTRRPKESVTIKVDDNTAKNMTFDF